MYTPPVPDPHEPDDRFCVYCQKQYARLGDFKRHVLKEHGVGLAKRLGLVPLDPGEVIEI
jgi:hypothetical protein